MKLAKKIKHIEVRGYAIYSMVEGFAKSKLAPIRILVDHGIGHITDKGDYEIGHDDWYPLINWLNAYDLVSEYYSEETLFNIGCQIPNYADFPPGISTIEDAIRLVNVAYHMNHRFKGKIMYDSRTNQIYNGIGHYGYEKIENENKIISLCTNLYPCDMDRGILTTMARKFQPAAQVIHEEPEICRKHGSDHCWYTITW